MPPTPTNEIGFSAAPLERASLHEGIAAQIEKAILSGELESGARLPSEDALAKEFGVSRPIVREALARLRDRGLVKTLTGSGTFVQQPDTDHLAQALLRHLREARTDSQSIRNLYEARIAIETMSAQLAAVRANDRDRAEILHHLTAMREVQDDRKRWTDGRLPLPPRDLRRQPQPLPQHPAGPARSRHPAQHLRNPERGGRVRSACAHTTRSGTRSSATTRPLRATPCASTSSTRNSSSPSGHSQQEATGWP